MLLKRRLIIMLRDFTRRNGAAPMSLYFFIGYVTAKKWPRRNYPFESQEFRLRVEETLRDCIGSNPDRHYIDYDEDRSSLLVTSLGRKLIEWRGFLDECLKRYGYLASFFVGIGLMGTVLKIIPSFLEFYSSVINKMV